MNRNTKIGAAIAGGAAAVAAAAVIGFGAGSAIVANAADTTPTPGTSAGTGTTGDQGPRGGRGEHGPMIQLDADTQAKVKAAAESAVDGGTMKFAKQDGTGYAAIVAKADGSMVEVKMDADFQVSTVTDWTGRGGRGGGSNETPLTGADAEKATAAAKAAVEGGTVTRVETDDDGVYEAHVTKADGTEVVVKMDKDFKVTGVEEFSGKGGRGGANETPLTGDDAKKATAAAEAAVEGGTVLRVETDSDGVYEAHVRKADGTEVEVKMDKDFKVTSVEAFVGRGGHDGDGPDSDGPTGATGAVPSTSNAA